MAGNEIPNTPDYTATFGAHLSHGLRADETVYARAEMTLYGAFKYDDLNTAEQSALLVGQRSSRPAPPLCLRRSVGAECV